MDEVENERAAVVAWLRAEADLRFLAAQGRASDRVGEYNHTRAVAMQMAANAIEAGNHREKQR